MSSDDNLQELIQIEKDIESGRNSLQKVRGDKAKKESDVSREEKRLDKLITERNKIKKDLSQLRLQFDEKEEDIKKRDQNIIIMKNEVESIEDKEEQLKDDLDETERKKTFIKRRMNNNSSQELTQADEKIRSGRNRLLSIRGDEATKKRDLSCEEEWLDKLMMEKNKIKKEINQLKLEFSEKEEEIKKIEQEIFEYNEEIKEMEEEIKQYEYDLKEAERKKVIIEKDQKMVA